MNVAVIAKHVKVELSRHDAREAQVISFSDSLARVNEIGALSIENAQGELVAFFPRSAWVHYTTENAR